jgi:DNA-directed RNA polymerase III subunit RPC6
MASTSAADVATPDAANRDEQLYEQCAARDPGTIFFLRDLSNMQVAEDFEELRNIVSRLYGQKLLNLLTLDNENCWKVRPRREAEKLRTIVPQSDEERVYQNIEQAQAEGVWIKALRAKTNLTQAALTKCLKALEMKDLVQSVMSVKHPNRKMYLLKTLTPSEDIAGGLWQNNGDFDSGMIDAMSELVYNRIKEDTCIKVAADWNNYEPSDRSQAIAHKKTHVMGMRDIEEAPAVRPPRSNLARFVHRANPNYPNANSMADFLNTIKVLKGRIAREQDMEQLLEMMVLEGKLEKVSAISYRTALSATDTSSFNGFVDAPCGTCPVFDLCADEGEITARTCVYFGEWLGTESQEVD